jgi:DNA-binding MarR family transcriptional regulator
LESFTSLPPNGDVGEGFDEYLFYLITQVSNRRSRDFAPALEAIGLSMPEWRAMSVINRLGGCLMSELSEFTTVDRTTLTRTVDQMVASNLVCRSASAQDRRQVMVALTEHGQALFDRSLEALKSSNLRMLDGLSPADLRTLRALLQRILMNIIQDPDHFQKVLRYER